MSEYITGYGYDCRPHIMLAYICSHNSDISEVKSQQSKIINY